MGPSSRLIPWILILVAALAAEPARAQEDSFILEEIPSEEIPPAEVAQPVRKVTKAKKVEKKKKKSAAKVSRKVPSKKTAKKPAALRGRKPASTPEKSDKPVKDKTLEQRLKVTRTYVSREGDTLESVAGLLYGHTSWWKRIQKGNRSLAKLTPKKRIPEGTTIKYKAPRVGTEYVVQKDDWLIRIALWRYGDTSNWEAIFRKNAAQIKNPNLIRPGDLLFLSDDGTVTNADSGQTIMQGTGIAAAASPAPLALASPEPMPSPTDVVAAIAREPAFAEPEEDNSFFLLGFAAGLLMLLLGMIWARSRSQYQADAVYKVTPADDWSDFETGTQIKPVDSRMTNFKRRPPGFEHKEKPVLHPVSGDVDRRPGYHSLLPKSWKKYLRFK